MNEDREKVDAYLTTISDHVLRPIAETDLKESCTATMLLIFGAIDGLGKMAHPKDKAGVAERFKWYMATFMPPHYKDHQDALYRLRCSIAHSALNFTAFISKTYMGVQHHLEYVSSLGFIFVSSSVLTRDFDGSLRRLEKALGIDSILVKRAAGRLQWLEDNTYGYWGRLSTPPGPTPFIHLK